MRKLALLCAFVALFAESRFFILEPSNQSPAQVAQGQYYTNEAFRAAGFGARNIARDLFYKACAYGDNLGCRALNEINAPLNIEGIVIARQECDWGVGSACVGVWSDYARIYALNPLVSTHYLSKACRLGRIDACESLRFTPHLKRRVVLSKAQFLSHKCAQNDAKHCYFLAREAISGAIMRRDRNYALALLKKSCQLGYYAACRDSIAKNITQDSAKNACYAAC